MEHTRVKLYLKMDASYQTVKENLHIQMVKYTKENGKMDVMLRINIKYIKKIYYKSFIDLII